MEMTNLLLISDDEIYSDRLTDCVRKMKTRVKISRINLEYIGDFERSELYKKMSLALENAHITKKILKTFKIILVDTEKIEKFQLIEAVLRDKFIETYAVILRLTEDITLQGDKEVYRLSKVSELINKVVQKYSFENSSYIAGHIINTDDTKIYSVISSKGGSGVSSIALGLSRELAMRKEENILYVSLGDYHQERYFFRWGRSNNIREYIFHMFYGDSRYCFSLDNYVRKDDFGVCHFNVNTFTNKINELKQEDFEKFIENILLMNLFSIIIFDLGSELSDKAKEILNMSDTTFFIGKRNQPNIKDFTKYMDITDENTVFIENFFQNESELDLFFREDEIEEKNNEDNINYRFRIERDDKAFFVNEGISDIRRDTNFTKDISKIVDEIYF